MKYFEDSWDVFDDVKPTLAELKNLGCKLEIISNGDLQQQIQKTKKVGIFDFFDYINTSSEFNFSKPNPLLFKTIFNLHNISFDKVCYVGDSYSKDILPTRKLGIKSILINRNKNKYQDNYLISVENLEKIIPLIK